MPCICLSRECDLLVLMGRIVLKRMGTSDSIYPCEHIDSDSNDSETILQDDLTYSCRLSSAREVADELNEEYRACKLHVVGR
jgi:hypothetical protein